MIRFAAPIVVVAVLALASPASAVDTTPMRHHLTLGLGVAQQLSDDFDDTGVETGALGQFAYRYSLNRSIDLTLDGRSVFASDDAVVPVLGDVDVEHESSWFGPGVRWNGGTGAVRPYLQANVFFVTEQLTFDAGDVETSTDETDAGFGVMGGVDIRLGRLLSLPLEVAYLYGKPENDVSALGMSVGLTFNFTPLP